MGKRRFAQVSTSDDEEEEEAHPPHKTRSSGRAETGGRRRNKKLTLPDEEEEEEVEESGRRGRRGKKKEVRQESEEEEDPSEEEEEEQPQDAKPIGDSVSVSGKGRGRRTHYSAFEYDGNQYEIEDPVLLVPEDKEQKPYVAIIKDITQTKDGSMMVKGQWFYRPEEAEKKGGGSWQSRDTRELFYSFHRDEVPAESVMHKCLVHFVPIYKQLPNRKQHPGFIVQKVYDTNEKKLWNLTDKDFKDNNQQEIDLLVQKTMSRLGELPDIGTEETTAEQEEQKSKRTLRKKTMLHLDVTREEESTMRPDNVKSETPGSYTPGSCTSAGSKYYSILVKFDVLTGHTQRDRWLERLLLAVQYICDSQDWTNDEDNGNGGAGAQMEPPKEQNDECSKAHKSDSAANGSQGKNLKGEKSFPWPDAAVPAVSALEKASHETLSSDFQKYNAKMRQLEFNLKNNRTLARRLLNGELEPSKILNMTPTELREGLTAEETARKEPEQLERIQMTDAVCSRCSEKNVGLRDIIQAGHGARYQLECNSCGHSWYSSRDEVSMLTIDGPSSARSVGTAPWATAKFEEVEKKKLKISPSGIMSSLSYWDYSTLVILRPALAITFVISLISLGWFLAWKLVLVHVPLVQEVFGLRKKKPSRGKPPTRRFSKYYNRQHQ